MKEITENIRALCDLMNSESFLDSVASFYWNLFIKLKKQGFTDEQAMLILGNISTKG